MVLRCLTCKRLLYESFGAVIWLAIDRAPQVKLAQLFPENTIVQTRSHEKFVLDKLSCGQGPAWLSILHMYQKINVLLDISHSSEREVASIVENARLRSGCAKSHAISSIETRERVILRF